MARRCSREASSGTTPPYGWWVAICEATTLETTCSPERTTAAAVSSQELSMPRMKASGMFLYYSKSYGGLDPTRAGNRLGSILIVCSIGATEILACVRESGFPFADRLIHLFVGGSELHGAKVHGRRHGAEAFCRMRGSRQIVAPARASRSTRYIAPPDGFLSPGMERVLEGLASVVH